MPAVSAKAQLAAVPGRQEEQALRPLLQALLDGVQALAAKLDADATVTDTNYAAVLAAIVTD
jgi:hypothetical protein